MENYLTPHSIEKLFQPKPKNKTTHVTSLLEIELQYLYHIGKF